MAQRPPCPKVIPIPDGYRRATAKEITPAVQAFARKALAQCKPYGKLQVANVNGQMFAALTEWHYDDHVTQPGKPIWHPGISILVPKSINPTLPSSAGYMPVTTGLTGMAAVEAKMAGEDEAVMAAETGVGADDEDPFGVDFASHDSVNGDDFGDIGDEFGAVARARVKARVNLKAKAKAKARVTAKRPPPARPAPARPAPARPAPARPARPTPARPSQPARPASAPQSGPSPMPMQQAEQEYQPTELDGYVMPEEETPETADEGSDTYNPDAIGSDLRA